MFPHETDRFRVLCAFVARQQRVFFQCEFNDFNKLARVVLRLNRDCIAFVLQFRNLINHFKYIVQTFDFSVHFLFFAFYFFIDKLSQRIKRIMS